MSKGLTDEPGTTGSARPQPPESFGLCSRWLKPL